RRVPSEGGGGADETGHEEEKIMPSTATEPVQTPKSEQELVELVRAGMPLQIIGSGTKRHHGPAPSDDGDVVGLRKLNRITAYEPGDLVVTVQAGAKLTE